MSTLNPALTLGATSPLGLEIPGSPAENPNPAPVRTAKPADKRGWWWGTGRRKTAVARIRIKPSSPEAASITIESTAGRPKPVDVFFTEPRDRNDCVAPIVSAGLMGRVQVVAKINGGGFMGQAQAMRLAIARALVDWDPNLYKSFRDAGFLTRDAREVERKKYGQAGARRRFQFSKR